MGNTHGLRLNARNRKDVDMTEGNILLHLVRFALPLLIGNLFQQLYNTVDMWVLGQFASNEAYAAAGSVGPVINTLIGFFMGLSSGAGVIISQYYGARQFDRVHDAVHTAIAMTGLLCIVFTILGIGIAPLMLQLMNVPENVLPESTTYLTIYFSGISGLMFYNIGAGILRAVGDSKRPFYFLVVCAVMNMALDLLFVVVLHAGIWGVALATVLSQCISAMLVIRALLHTDTCIKLTLSQIRLHWDMLKKIFRVGIPAALQMAVTAFSNVFVQSYINYFGDDCMSGWATYAKVDALLWLPGQSISLATTTFVGQNLGKKQPKRARKGVTASILLALVATLIPMTFVMIFTAPISAFFNPKPAVVEYAAMLLRLMSPFYLLCIFSQVYASALRGAGNSKVPMIIMLGSYVVFRQLYLFVVSQICNEITYIALSYPAGWLVCSIITAVYYYTTKLERTRLVED